MVFFPEKLLETQKIIYIFKLKNLKKTNFSAENRFSTQKIGFFPNFSNFQIIENYQLEVASEIRTHRPFLSRSIAPVPFNIDILDDEEEEMEIS